MEAATKEPAATRSAITAKIAEVVKRDVPAAVMDASRIVDSEIAAKRRELDELVQQRNKIDANFGVSQKLAAKQAAHDREVFIKATAEKVLALNAEICSTIDEAQRLLAAGFAKIKAAEALFPEASATMNKLDMRCAFFSQHDFKYRLGEHVARSLCDAWPGNTTRLGSLVEWHFPPGYAGKPKAWSEIEMNSERTAAMQSLARMVEQRRYLDEPSGDASIQS